MKKIFTFGIFLFLLSGIGNNVSATQFIANTGIRPGTWNAKSTWYPAGTDTITTPANTPLPTYLDDVTIPAGDSILLNATGYCQNLTLNGVLVSVNGGLTANGNITVNKSGTLAIKSNFQCTNIYNYGKVWCWNTNGVGSPKTLFVGYTYNGSTTAGTGDYTILNDSIFGDYRTRALTSTNSGSGIYVIFSNLSKSLTIKTSGKTSGYAFTVGGIYPDTKTPVAQDFNLNIQESMALLKSGGAPDLSLSNNDAFNGFNRTCTISYGDTVFINGGFHMKNGAAPSANQGNMTYNIYGCLDLASYKASSSANEFDLYTTTFAGSTSSLIMNIGDGTSSNPGTLILGKTTNLVKSLSTQTLKINTSQYSTVKFGYTFAAPTITCTTAGTADNTLFPTSLYNLGIATGTYSVPLPSSLSLRVKNALTLTSGNVTLGSSSLIAGSISGGSTNSYVITSGTGALSTKAATSGTLFPIGTATGYAPVTITPASNDTISALVSATPTGTFTGNSVNLNEWTLTPQIATTAALAFTPTTATYTTSPAIFSGVASGIYAAKTAATVSGTTYSATGISLAASATPFATGGITPSTAVETNTSNSVLVYSANNSLVVKNAKDGDVITVYGLTGSKVVTSVVKGDNTTLALAPGAYIVKVGSTTKKVLVQ